MYEDTPRSFDRLAVSASMVLLLILPWTVEIVAGHRGGRDCGCPICARFCHVGGGARSCHSPALDGSSWRCGAGGSPLSAVEAPALRGVPVKLAEVVAPAAAGDADAASPPASASVCHRPPTPPPRELPRA
jgi:hypothetical protein